MVRLRSEDRAFLEKNCPEALNGTTINEVLIKLNFFLEDCISGKTGTYTKLGVEGQYVYDSIYETAVEE